MEFNIGEEIETIENFSGLPIGTVGFVTAIHNQGACREIRFNDVGLLSVHTDHLQKTTNDFGERLLKKYNKERVSWKILGKDL